MDDMCSKLRGPRHTKGLQEVGSERWHEERVVWIMQPFPSSRSAFDNSGFCHTQDLALHNLWKSLFTSIGCTKA